MTQFLSLHRYIAKSLLAAYKTSLNRVWWEDWEDMMITVGLN